MTGAGVVLVGCAAALFIGWDLKARDDARRYTAAVGMVGLTMLTVGLVLIVADPNGA